MEFRYALSWGACWRLFLVIFISYGYSFAQPAEQSPTESLWLNLARSNQAALRLPGSPAVPIEFRERPAERLELISEPYWKSGSFEWRPFSMEGVYFTNPEAGASLTMLHQHLASAKANLYFYKGGALLPEELDAEVFNAYLKGLVAKYKENITFATLPVEAPWGALLQASGNYFLIRYELTDPNTTQDSMVSVILAKLEGQDILIEIKASPDEHASFFRIIERFLRNTALQPDRPAND